MIKFGHQQPSKLLRWPNECARQTTTIYSLVSPRRAISSFCSSCSERVDAAFVLKRESCQVNLAPKRASRRPENAWFGVVAKYDSPALGDPLWLQVRDLLILCENLHICAHQ